MWSVECGKAYTHCIYFLNEVRTVQYQKVEKVLPMFTLTSLVYCISVAVDSVLWLEYHTVWDLNWCFDAFRFSLFLFIFKMCAQMY